MVDVSDMHSLAEFQRDARRHIRHLKQTGKPEALTINGRTEVVLQSAKAYRKLVRDADMARSLRVIQKSLRDAEAGRVRPARQFIEEFAAEKRVDLGK